MVWVLPTRVGVKLVNPRFPVNEPVIVKFTGVHSVRFDGDVLMVPIDEAWATTALKNTSGAMILFMEMA
jgi:hypothetical protein